MDCKNGKGGRGRDGQYWRGANETRLFLFLHVLWRGVGWDCGGTGLSCLNVALSYAVHDPMETVSMWSDDMTGRFEPFDESCCAVPAAGADKVV